VQSGAEQFFLTSGQQEQTPAVHSGFQSAVTSTQLCCSPPHSRAFYWLIMTVKGATLRKALPGSAFTKRLILDL